MLKYNKTYLMSLNLQFTIYISSQFPLPRGFNILDMSLKYICLCEDDNAASKDKAIIKSG